MLDKSRIKEQGFATASKHDVIERRRRSCFISIFLNFFSRKSICRASRNPAKVGPYIMGYYITLFG